MERAGAVGVAEPNAAASRGEEEMDEVQISRARGDVQHSLAAAEGTVPIEVVVALHEGSDDGDGRCSRRGDRGMLQGRCRAGTKEDGDGLGAVASRCYVERRRDGAAKLERGVGVEATVPK